MQDNASYPCFRCPSSIHADWKTPDPAKCKPGGAFLPSPTFGWDPWVPFWSHRDNCLPFLSPAHIPPPSQAPARILSRKKTNLLVRQNYDNMLCALLTIDRYRFTRAKVRKNIVSVPATLHGVNPSPSTNSHFVARSQGSIASQRA